MGIEPRILFSSLESRRSRSRRHARVLDFEDEYEDDDETDVLGYQGRSSGPVTPLFASKREFCSRFGSHGQQLLLTVGFSSPDCPRLPKKTR